MGAKGSGARRGQGGSSRELQFVVSGARFDVGQTQRNVCSRRGEQVRILRSQRNRPDLIIDIRICAAR